MNTTAKTHNEPLRVLMLDIEGDYYSWAQDVRNLGCNWDLLRVDSTGSLVSYLKERDFQAVVVAPSTQNHRDQDSLLKTMNLQQQAIRVVLPGIIGSPSQISRTSELAHRVYDETQSNSDIAQSIEIQVKLNKLINKPKNREFLSTGGPLPSIPRVYGELTAALNSANSSIPQIANIVQQDPALAVKVLKMVNSAFFALPRPVSNIAEAVSMLGLRMLRGLALSGHLADLYPQNKQWQAFSFERVHTRSLLVGRLAMKIAKDMKTNVAVQDQAFVAGLLHDIGTLFIASKAPARYQQVLELSGEKSAAICAVEKKLLGFFHGEIGAYLLAHLGLPAQAIEAVLLHHTPQLCGDHQFTPLTAVHIADTLIPAVPNTNNALLSNKLVTGYVKAAGVEQHIGRWQVEAKNMCPGG